MPVYKLKSAESMPGRSEVRKSGPTSIPVSEDVEDVGMW